MKNSNNSIEIISISEINKDKDDILKTSKYKKNGDSFLFKYFLSCTAATIAETITYPLDLTKTRLQVQGEHSFQQNVRKTHYRGMVQTAVGIVREEGIFKLWQGSTPAVCRHLVYTGCRMGFYEFFRDKILGKNADGTFPIHKAIVGGLSAGALAQFIASPADLVKIRMQMEGRRRMQGYPVRVKSTLHAITTIIREGGGVLALWKGWIPNVQRAALVNLGELTTYDTVKHRILKYTKLEDAPITHALSSICSGLVAAVVGTPADVIKTRYMNQCFKDGRGVLYKGSIDCFIKTVQGEGVAALYKGFIPIWMRMAPWSFTFWLSYEQIRLLSGTSSF